MDAWSTGPLVLVVLGLAAVVFGALHDRARHRRRTAEMLAPPARAIPRFAPDAPSPQYLSELQARRPPATPAPTLGATERTQVERLLRDDGAVRVRAGYASAAFVTEPDAGWAVLEEPVVLVCADEVASLRELLGLLERVLLSRRALVLVAPGVASDVLSTLEVNQIQRKLAVVVVLPPDGAQLELVARACEARLTERGDRQAGYLPGEDLGACRRWVSTSRESRLVPVARDS